jgi:hypothetical protein
MTMPTTPWAEDPRFTDPDVPSPRYLARLMDATHDLSRHAVPETTDKD